MYKIRPILFIFAAFVLTLSTIACGLGSEATPTAVPQDQPQNQPQATDEPVSGGPPDEGQPTETERPPVTHLTSPGEPTSGTLSEITDRDSSVVASEKRALGGENYNLNLYERPFNAEAMDQYFPDLDILRARLSEDSDWVYVTIRMVDEGQGGEMTGSYGVEVDLNVDGRGDFLVFATMPGDEWSVEGVRVWLDENDDVGGTYPMVSEAPWTGDGYETLAFDEGYGDDPDLAWARRVPGEATDVQIAFKVTLLKYDNAFMWGVWTDRSVLNPGWFDYHDHFTAAEMGSSLVESEFYPIKALYELDNTCRWVVGFTPTGSEPGICPVPATPTAVAPGTVSGVVYNNKADTELVLKTSSVRIGGATVRARAGDCGAPGVVVDTTLTNRAGEYTFTLNSGVYCIDVYPDPVAYTYKTPPQTVTITPGGAVTGINFGYAYKLNMH